MSKYHVILGVYGELVDREIVFRLVYFDFFISVLNLESGHDLILKKNSENLIQVVIII